MVKKTTLLGWVYLRMVSSRPLVLASCSRSCLVVSSSSCPAEGAPSSSHLSLSAFDYQTKSKKKKSPVRTLAYGKMCSTQHNI